VGGPATGPAADRPSPETTAARAELVAEVTALVGSAREARWIVEDAESRGGDRGSFPEEVVVVARALATRRATGEPLQYVLGRWPFRELELAVDRRVLIPRPETEQLVELALAELTRIDAGSPGGTRLCVDLGTGSGAIALSLATEGARIAPQLEVWATDRSPEALRVARTNLSALTDSGAKPAKVHLELGRWFGALPASLAGAVDLVTSNPPYVSDEEFEALDASVREWEPPEALRAAPGADGTPGLADIEEIVTNAPEWLRANGALVLEFAPHQADAAASAARRAGLGDVSTPRDLAGRARFLVARRS
jgi:release factor glutamine methyltransferase